MRVLTRPHQLPVSKARRITISDGWTMNDLIYRWIKDSPVQMVANLSLPGGFKLDNFGSVNCDVITATGNNDQRKFLLLFKLVGDKSSNGHSFKKEFLINK